jgi:hypothetical protein
VVLSEFVLDPMSHFPRRIVRTRVPFPHCQKRGLKVLEKFDVATPGGEINTTATLLKQNRKLMINFLKGYMEGIHFLIHQ